MKISAPVAVAALGAAIALTACASDYGPRRPYADVEFTGFYDDYYGPFYGGYWGPSGVFYYADRDGRHFHRDRDHHFRQEPGAGYHPIHGHAPPAAGQHPPRAPRHD